MIRPWWAMLRNRLSVSPALETSERPLPTAQRCAEARAEWEAAEKAKRESPDG